MQEHITATFIEHWHTRR